MNILMKTLMVAVVVAFCGTAHADIIIGGDTGDGTPPPDSRGVMNLGNGNFEAQSTGTGGTYAPDGALTFAGVTGWHNLGGAESINFGVSSGLVGSPESSSQGAFLFAGPGRVAANDTGYTILTAGEVFDVSFYLGKFGGAAAYDGATVRALLFTSTTGVDDDTIFADISILGTFSVGPIEGFSVRTGNAFYTSVVGDVGKTVYLGLDLLDTAGAVPSPRIDVVRLDVTPVPEPSLLGMLALLGLGLLRRKRA